MGRTRGNAGDWTPADAIAQDAELDAVSNPASTTRVEVHRTYEADKKKAKALLELAAKACKNAGNGRLASMKPSGRGYVVVITEPKGKKK